MYEYGRREPRHHAAMNIVTIVLVVAAIAWWSFQYGVVREKDWSCRDFHTQEEAQKMYNRDTTDPYRLDGNKNGIACEDLPDK